MTECQTRKDLVLFAEGITSAEEARRVSRHLSECESCRRELADLNAVRDMLADPQLFAPQEDYKWQALPRTIAVRAGTARTAPPGFADRLWTLAMAATLVFAVALAWIAQKGVQPGAGAASPADRIAAGNSAFLGRIQTAYAREATTEYLAGCQDVLLDVVRAEKTCDGKGYDVSFEAQRARELLSRKRLLDRELNAPDVARAKNLCDDLEHFLVNLSTSEKCETPDNLRHMETYIERQQLLLRINVLQSELL